MTTVTDREQAIISETKDLLDFYAVNGGPDVVRLFAEDYDFLDKREAITHGERDSLEGMWVIRGQRKKRIRKRRPKESLFP